MKKIINFLVLSLFLSTTAFSANAIDSDRGKAYPIVGSVGIASGGTGQTSAQAALDALIGASTNGYILQYNSGSSHWLPAANGASLWTNNGTLDSLSTTTHNVALGSASLIDSAKFGILGNADVPTFVVKGSSGQTSDLSRWELNNGTTVAYVDIAGTIHGVGTGGGVITLGGATSGTLTLQPTSVEGTNTVTFPAATGTVALTTGAANFYTTGNIGIGTTTTSQQLSIGSTGQTYFNTSGNINNLIPINNAITASGNAATVPVTSKLSTVTNNSAATLTITITTAGATDGQSITVRVLDFSGVAQTITWVNTENSSVTAATTSNGSTTLPRTEVFQYNGGTSKWRCVGDA